VFGGRISGGVSRHGGRAADLGGRTTPTSLVNVAGDSTAEKPNPTQRVEG
jgi:hypothetical protein